MMEIQNGRFILLNKAYPGPQLRIGWLAKALESHFCPARLMSSSCAMIFFLVLAANNNCDTRISAASLAGRPKAQRRRMRAT
jgi:hypothetical protein